MFAEPTHISSPQKSALSESSVSLREAYWFLIMPNSNYGWKAVLTDGRCTATTRTQTNAHGRRPQRI
jgi:hypothetical protein